MKAIVINAYGSPDVLELKEVDKPEVLENDVLVQVQAAGINAGDYFSMRGRGSLDFRSDFQNQIITYLVGT